MSKEEEEAERCKLIDFCKNNREVDLKRLDDNEILDIVNRHLERIIEVNEYLDNDRKQYFESLSNNH